MTLRPTHPDGLVIASSDVSAQIPSGAPTRPSAAGVSRWPAGSMPGERGQHRVAELLAVRPNRIVAGRVACLVLTAGGQLAGSALDEQHRRADGRSTRSRATDT